MLDCLPPMFWWTCVASPPLRSWQPATSCSRRCSNSSTRTSQQPAAAAARARAARIPQAQVGAPAATSRQPTEPTQVRCARSLGCSTISCGLPGRLAASSTAAGPGSNALQRAITSGPALPPDEALAIIIRNEKGRQGREAAYAAGLAKQQQEQEQRRGWVAACCCPKPQAAPMDTQLAGRHAGKLAGSWLMTCRDNWTWGRCLRTGHAGECPGQPSAQLVWHGGSGQPSAPHWGTECRATHLPVTDTDLGYRMPHHTPSGHIQ
jgi:hypothetical protein